jgi:NTP pyrophosphatase (non-canonical NTP hydrolase)
MPEMYDTVTENDARAPQALTLQAVRAEMIRARIKFPENNVLLAALMEEVGELANALLELRFACLRGEVEGADAMRDAVQREAIQVASTALRILEDGTSEFPQYRPPAR